MLQVQKFNIVFIKYPISFETYRLLDESGHILRFEIKDDWTQQ